jgi:hypothetical protein
MALIHSTRSCSLNILECHNYDTKINIQEVMQQWSQDYNSKAIYCLIKPEEMKLEDIIEELGFKFVVDFKRSHDPGKIKMYLYEKEN